MDDQTDKLKQGAESKWTAPPRKERTRRREEDEGEVLGRTPTRSMPQVSAHTATGSTAASRAQDHAEVEFRNAILRCDSAYRDRLPESYDQNLHQKTMRDHFTRWVEDYGEEMVKWAITKFFREEYLYEQPESSYRWAPHTNLSNWMVTPGSAAIRIELRWRSHVEKWQNEARERE